jgi:hypothetical protein
MSLFGYENKVKNTEETQQSFTNDNVSILKKLNYYNLNINDIKTNFVIETMNYLIYCDNPNYEKNISVVNLDLIDENEMKILCNEFINLCDKKNKNKMDFTINEINLFIKNTNTYKFLVKELNFKLKRAVMLSKYTNDTKAKKIINDLTLNELEILTK